MTALSICLSLLAPSIILFLCLWGIYHYPGVRLSAARIAAGAVFSCVLGLGACLLHPLAQQHDNHMSSSAGMPWVLPAPNQPSDSQLLFGSIFLALLGMDLGLLVLLGGYIFQATRTMSSDDDVSRITRQEFHEAVMEFCRWEVFLLSVILPPLVIPLAMVVGWRFPLLRRTSVLVGASALAVCVLVAFLIYTGTDLFVKSSEIRLMPAWLADGLKILPFVHLGLLLMWFSSLLDERKYYQPASVHAEESHFS
jgi:hypothetical protein